MSSIRKRGARRRRMAMAGVGAAAAVVAGVQLSPAAFGTGGDDEPVAVHPAAGAEDFGATRSDGTAFEDGVMSLKSAPVARSAAPSGSSGRAAAAAPHGTGWQSGGASKYLTTGYTIKFYDKKSADWLAPYVKKSAADLQRVTTLPVRVDTQPVGWDYVRPKGEIIVGVLHRPCVPPSDGGSQGWKVVRDGSGSKNLSCGFYSSSVADTVTSGHAYIDDEFLTSAGKPAPSMGETYFRNHISHELGHTMGLAHANRSATRGDCVKGSDSGQFPVMCTPTNAYQDKRAGTYVQQYDMQGLRHLARGGGAALPPQGKVTGLGRKCLDAKGGKAANGTQIQIHTCNSGPGQSWILQKDSTIRALGKCLDNYRNASTNGNKIALSDCHGGASQRWKVNAKGQIVHVASGKVLDVKGGSTANGTKVQLYAANTYKRQIWVTPK
ncbi:ricin-type beta-trefoil lectin domain protein [Streptomyces sp. Je 1-369]|uniref:ricin-type beta-trefoil lectin domain protein n=1 Tax=Streptomyces sp. Je 1-369 TaxID=2966192 RepID=UPI0022863D1D|nr:ricin-type beta-trefoil lectin domain protein [Streptomyces sp. Je 1-369]WAL94136.1 ricin-type beta-trefoil lectin domain protein [Streptomyces sp. Je 1-369]